MSFPASGGCLHFLANGLFLTSTQSLHLLLIFHSDSTSIIIPLPLSSLTLLPLCVDLCDDIQIFQIIQDNLYPKILKLIIFANSLLPYKVTYSQVLGIRTWTSLEVHYLTYHNPTSAPEDSCLAHMKMHSPQPNFPKTITYCNIISNTKISCKSHQLKSPKFHYLKHVNQS